MEDPTNGGLGGRFVKSATNPYRWEDGQVVTDFDPYTNKAETSYPQVRWIEGSSKRLCSTCRLVCK